MKHLGVYVVLSVLVVALFGGFVHPENTYAAGDKTALLAQGTAIFDTKAAELQGAASINPALAAKLIKSVQETKQVFLKEFNDPKPGLWGVPTDPTEIYNQALKAAFDYNFTSERYVFCTNAPTKDTQGCTVIEEFGLLLSKTIDPTAKLGSPDTLASAEQKSKAAVTNIKPPAKCESLITNFLQCLDVGTTWFVKTILLEIVGFGVWVSANLLNYAMFHGIFEFKNFAPDSIYAMWLVIRQIVSLFVFFAGLFVGFMAIIGRSEDFKKYIAFLVVFGLFVNFSYPVVRLFVDISNVVSLQIYQNTLGPTILSDNSAGSVGDLFMSKMGLQDLVVNATAAKSGGTVKFQDTIASLPGALAAVGFVGYAAYIFFMAAFLIIARTALLVCIIIASPLLLVDTVVPALGEKAKWLRGMFISQLFVAPVFTIMLALTLKFLDIFKATSGNVLTGAAAGNNVAVFFNLVMMIIMLHIMLKVTKAVAGGVGETVTKWAGKAGGLGVGLGIGVGAAGLGFAGRQTFGRLGEHLGQQGGVIGSLGRQMSSGKYDLRNLPGTQSMANVAGVKGVGRGVDRSRKEMEDARNAENAKVAEKINDPEEREIFLRRKFGTGSKEYKNFNKEDDEVLRRYIGADADRRQEMMDDDKNKRFGQRFGSIDNGTMSGVSPAVQKALDDKLAKDKAADVRNNDRIANYLTADQTARDNMYTNALAANDKKLLDQLTVMEQLRTQQAGTITQSAVAALGDPALGQKVLANDASRAAAQATQQAQVAAQQTQAAAQQAIQQAQAQAAQAQIQAAQETKSAIDSLVKSNNDLAQQLKTLVNA